MKLVAAVLALLLVLSPAVFGLGEDPAEIVRQLEQRLLTAQRVVIESDIRAQGIVAVHLRGRAELTPRNHLTLTGSGSMFDKTVALSLRADSRTLEMQHGSAPRHESVAPESNRAIIIGLVRMGLLHNLARLSTGQGPDHAGGGVEQWVALDSYRPTTFAQDGELEGTFSFGFDIQVDGQPAGSARLWLDPVSGLPRRREQTVRFPQGEMKVVEDYRQFVVD